MADSHLPYSRQLVTEEDIDAVCEALRDPIISQGGRLAAFEKAFAEEMNAPFAVALSSGTAALHGMCVGCGIGPDDEVLVPALTFAATANAVLYTGARPVFVDVDPVTHCISVDAVEAAITDRTRAILAVDFAGHPADYKHLRALADNRGIHLLADCAHSPGATINGDLSAGFVDLAAFSFNPVKNMTSAEGGIVTSSNPDYIEVIRRFRTHGMTREPALLKEASHGDWYYEQQSLGFNYKLSELHAALGLSQLKRLKHHTRIRRNLATLYDTALEDLPVERPVVQDHCESAWHLYVIRVAPKVRRELFDTLREAQIGVQIHYLPVPMHPFFRELGYTMNGLDQAAAYYESAISLPLHQSMTESDVERVVGVIGRFFS